MNRPEPIELENNLGPDAVTGEINRVPWMAYDVDEMDLYIADLEQKLAEKYKEIESLKASHYAESVDAGMRERRLRRALWLARAYSAYMNKLYINADWYSGCEKDFDFWTNTEKYCQAKAEEYK